MRDFINISLGGKDGNLRHERPESPFASEQHDITRFGWKGEDRLGKPQSGFKPVPANLWKGDPRLTKPGSEFGSGESEFTWKMEEKLSKSKSSNDDLVAEYGTVYDLSGGDGVTIQGLKSLRDDMKGKLDGMNEMSEMTSLRLQMTMDRRSKFISTLSQMMKKISTTQDILIQNIK